MKNITSLTAKSLLLIFALTLSTSACRWLRERKAEHHQPFKPHKDHKQKRGKNNRR